MAITEHPGLERMEAAVAQLAQEGKEPSFNAVYQLTKGHRGTMLTLWRQHYGPSPEAVPDPLGTGTDLPGTGMEQAGPGMEPPGTATAEASTAAVIEPDWAPIAQAIGHLQAARHTHREAVKALALLNKQIDARVLADYVQRLRRELGLDVRAPGSPMVVLGGTDHYEDLRGALTQATHAVSHAAEALPRCEYVVEQARKEAIFAAQKRWLLAQHPALATQIQEAERLVDLAPDSPRLRQALQERWRALLAHRSEAPTWDTDGPQVPKVLA